MRRGRVILLVCIALMAWACDSSEESVSTEEQLLKDIVTIDAYLTEQGIDANKDLTGVRFVIHTQGSDLPPRKENKVKMNYSEKDLTTGELLGSGTIVKRVDELMPGANIGVILLPAGTKATLFIPSTYYYPDQSPARILIYDVELIEVIKSATELVRFASDTTMIRDFLNQKSITTTKDPTGVHYIIQAPGSGLPTTWYTQVKINYTGKVLGNDEPFITGTSGPTSDYLSRVVDYQLGLQVGIQKLKEGGKITLYVPSGLGFGATSPTNLNVPSNSNLVFEIELADRVD